MRQTSLLAWAEMKSSGLLTQRQAEVFEGLRKAKRPATARELERFMKKQGMPHDGCWKRLSELVEKKVARECPKRTCYVTRRKAITWEALL